MDLSVSYESKVAILKQREQVYQFFGKLCKKSRFSNLAGLPLCFANHTLRITQSFANLGELAFKGSANIAAAPFVKKASVVKGLSQLGLILPKFMGLCFLPIYLLVDGFIIQSGLLFSGTSFTKKRAERCELDAINAKLSFSQIIWYNKLELKDFQKLKKATSEIRKEFKIKKEVSLNKLKYEHSIQKQNLLSSNHTPVDLKALYLKQIKEIKELKQKHSQFERKINLLVKETRAKQIANHKELRKNKLPVEVLKKTVKGLNSSPKT